jgi:voltage-gated potassium channel Kch
MDFNRHLVAVDNRRSLIHTWQERFRDPALTVLLVLEICTIFLAVPLAAEGLPIARAAADPLVLAVLVIVVTLSLRWGANISILPALAAIAASFVLSGESTPVSTTVLRRGGDILTFSALTWVVAHAVYAPGRITFRRLQGAIVLYLNFATIFASAYALIRELNPGSFANLGAGAGGPEEVGTWLYFSLTTLTTTGYGDIVAVDPFARSLANFESVLGQFYLAITVARLVTLELGRPAPTTSG